ncbi:MAG TPA: PIN domain-containing protein, partial [Acidimicrobiales bacterium]|nr:PIN domain-containing protein [Acidimicrobiales bacterium]
RLIIPILVMRELDDLKNFGKTPKARPRLRRIFEILRDKGRGPSPIREGITLELLMDPPRYSPLPVHDEEIVRRALYLRDRKGGILTLITGDYTMLASAGAEGLRVVMTPAELALP